MKIVQIVIFAGFNVEKIVKKLADWVCPQVDTIRCAVAAPECGAANMVKDNLMNGTNMSQEQDEMMQHALDGLATALQCVCDCPLFLNLTKTMVDPELEDPWGKACEFIPNLMPCFNTADTCVEVQDVANNLLGAIELEMLMLNCISMDEGCGMVENNQWRIPRNPRKRTHWDNCTAHAYNDSLTTFKKVDGCCSMMQEKTSNISATCMAIDHAVDKDFAKQWRDSCPNAGLPTEDSVNHYFCEAERVMKSTVPVSLMGPSNCGPKANQMYGMASSDDPQGATSEGADLAVISGSKLALLVATSAAVLLP